jgi:hypothetical protein
VFRILLGTILLRDYNFEARRIGFWPAKKSVMGRKFEPGIRRLQTWRGLSFSMRAAAGWLARFYCADDDEERKKCSLV